MLLVRPAAWQGRHHEAFKYNYGLFFFFLPMQKNAKPSNVEELAQMCVLERFPTTGRECVAGGASVAGVELGGSQEWPAVG